MLHPNFESLLEKVAFKIKKQHQQSFEEQKLTQEEIDNHPFIDYLEMGAWMNREFDITPETAKQLYNSEAYKGRVWFELSDGSGWTTIEDGDEWFEDEYWQTFKYQFWIYGEH